MQPARDFLAESDELHALVGGLTDEQLGLPTQFKAWTAEDIVGHLHFGNIALDLSLRDPAGFVQLRARILQHLGTGASLRAFERTGLEGLQGRELVSAWRKLCVSTAARFAATDPAHRLAWIGPDMSARTAVAGRLMETWAHGQAIYDAAGLVRRSTDRIQGIVVLGINTFGWSFANRLLAVPGPMPHVRLTAPSGAVWVHGDPSDTERIEGLAEEFCQVVTQTRNLADTRLRVAGATATAWLQNAQCFGGPAEPPPPPGARTRAATPWSA